MDIRLKSLHMENFKGHSNRTIDFDGRNTNIFGNNGAGKTSVYDALTWVLFGKSSTGKDESSMGIKPVDEYGNIRDNRAVTEVEAVFLVDGCETAFKRTRKEVWSRKRGAAEETKNGNTSEYYVDGVPCKANVYKGKVAELVDEEKFQLLTSVFYFSEKLHWKKRREILFSLFGVLDDRQIMETDERFSILLAAMGKLPMDDYKKVVTQKRRGFMATRNEVPARISECEKTISDLSSLDFDGADAQLSVLNSRLGSLNTELLAIEQNTAVQSKELELKRAFLEKESLETDNRKFRDGQKVAAPTASILEGDLRQRRNTLDSVNRSLEMRMLDIQNCDASIEDARAQWKKINAEQFAGNDTCPTCGQKFPASQIQSAADGFAADKKRRCDELVKRSERFKSDKAKYQKEADENRQYIAELEAEIHEMEEKISSAKAAAASIVITDMPDYAKRKAEIQEKITTIQNELTKLREDSSSAASGLRSRIAEIKSEVARVNAVAGKRSVYEYAQGRITKLREDAQAAADNLNELDRLLYLMEEFSQYKASFLEGSINDRFRIARFRLFKPMETNDGITDCCDVTYRGVSFEESLNLGAKFNTGIDIINTLSRAYGVTVPLFVDNAESVTNLEKTDCQVVRLIVSENDKELRINYEN